MGLLGSVLLNGMLGLAGYGAARHLLRQPPGLPRAVAAGILAWAWATLGVLMLGGVGALGFGPLLGWAAGGLGLAAIARGIRPLREGPAAKADRPWDAAAVAALGLAVWACLVIGGPSLLRPVKVVSDGPIYHLYFAARWWKAGRIVLVATPFGETAAPYFPAGGDAWFTWLVAGWGGDRLARVGQAPFLLLAAAATYAGARRLGVGASAAAVAVAWFVTSLPLLLFSFEPNVDTIFVAGYLAAAYFLLRFALGDGGLDALALAGLAAGGAWGTKPTATVFVPPLLALGVAAVLRRPGPKGRRLAVLLATAALLPAPWFLRSLALTGNPLYPLQVSAFGRVVLTGWFGPGVMHLSPYYLAVSDGRSLVEILLAVFDPRLAPLWLAAVAGAWWLARGRRGWLAGCAGLAAANVALYWLLIPYRTQQRFMLHALGLAAVPLAALLDRNKGLRWLAAVLLLIHLVTPQAWPFERPPWDLSPVIPSAGALVTVPLDAATWRAVLAEPAPAAYILATLAFGLASVATVVTWRRAGTTRRRRVVAAGATALLVGSALAAIQWGTGARQAAFPPFADYARGWRALQARAGAGPARIAYAGTNLPYYLMGPDLRHDVRYVNIDAHPDWLLHDYHREARRAGRPNWPTPRPGWDRIRPDYDAWRANLIAAKIDYLVVARANPQEGPFNVADAEGFPIERVWADAHPDAFRPVYGAVEGDPLFRIYRVLAAD